MLKKYIFRNCIQSHTAMKKFALILSLLSLFSIHYTQAQRFYFGPKAGLNMSSITQAIYQYNDDHLTNSQFLGFAGGAVGVLEFNNGFAIQTEVLFSRKGSRLDLNFDTIDYRQKGHRSIALNYVEIPVLLKQHFGGGGVRMYVNAGPYFSYWLGGSENFKLTQYYPNEEVQTELSTDLNFDDYWLPNADQNLAEANRWDLGVGFGGGFAYDSGPGLLLIDLRYNMGLRDLNRWLEGVEVPEDYRTLENRVFNLSFTYLISF